MALVAVVCLVVSCAPPPAILRFLSTATPTPTPTPTHTPTPSPTPTHTPTPTPSRTPTITPSPTVTPTPSPPPTPTPLPPEAHLWLVSPLAFDKPDEPYQTDYLPYGADRKPFRLHHGLDFPKPAGTPVHAVAAATVRVAGDDKEVVYGVRADFYGNLVILELERRFLDQAVYVLYAHLSEVTVKVGQRVGAGDVVGLVGGTGAAYGAAHLHVEVRLGENRYENTRNPLLWIVPDPGHGIIAGIVLDAQGKPLATTPVSFFRAATPAKWWRGTLTYANQEVNPDEVVGESFCLGYVPAGDYLVQVKLGAKYYVQPVYVEPGKIAFVQIRTGP